MSIVLTCGHEFSGHTKAYEYLTIAGLAPAKPAARSGHTPQDITRLIRMAYKVPAEGAAPVAQIRPGQAWNSLLGDLMFANIEQQDWGWADARGICLLEHWRDFDPLFKFVLVYSSPEQAAAELMKSGTPSPEALQELLAEWSAVNAELVRYHHANRDRCILVNSAAVVADPYRFLDLASGDLGIELQTRPPIPLANEPPDALAMILARHVIGENDDARLLYQELESVAHMPMEEDGGSTILAVSGWSQYQELRAREDELERAREERLALEREKEELRQRLLQAEARIEEVGRERAEVESRLEEATNALAETREKLRALEEERERLAREHGNAVNENKALDAQINSLKARIQELEERVRQHGKDGKEIARVEERARQAAREKELLALQLEQTQQELERYFREYQKLRKQGGGKQAGAGEENVGARPAVSGSRDAGEKEKQTGEKAPAVLDLRHFIDGDNWYYAEHDGRWAGPKTKSTLRLPAVPAGRYRLEMEIVGAMSPEIMQEMQVWLQGKPLNLRRRDSRSALRRLFGGPPRFPVVLSAEVEVAAGQGGKGPVLELRFPRTISPASRGSDDERELAVRMRQVKLSPV